MYRMSKPWSWFNNKIKTKDDLQFMLVVLFIVFIVFTKCYMAFFGPTTAKQPANAAVARYNTTTKR